MSLGENCRLVGKTGSFFAIVGAHLADVFSSDSQSEFLTSGASQTSASA
jgi:hypothetical protein